MDSTRTRPADERQGLPPLSCTDLLGAPTAKDPSETEGLRRIETKKASGRTSNLQYGQFVERLERARMTARRMREEIETNHDAIAMNPVNFRGLLAQLVLTSKNLHNEFGELLEAVPST